MGIRSSQPITPEYKQPPNKYSFFINIYSSDSMEYDMMKRYQINVSNNMANNKIHYIYKQKGNTVYHRIRGIRCMSIEDQGVITDEIDWRPYSIKEAIQRLTIIKNPFIPFVNVWTTKGAASYCSLSGELIYRGYVTKTGHVISKDSIKHYKIPRNLIKKPIKFRLKEYPLGRTIHVDLMNNLMSYPDYRELPEDVGGLWFDLPATVWEKRDVDMLYDEMAIMRELMSTPQPKIEHPIKLFKKAQPKIEHPI